VFVRLASTSSQPCDTQQAVSLRYTLMQSVDADHRAVMSFQWAQAGEKAKAQGSAAIKPSEEWSEIAYSNGQGNEGASQSAFATLSSFIVLGIEHIASGADHIAFIICLVLGLALRHLREWKSLLITVTAFTLGHSITLISATLGWVGSPSWVEPMIALSIAVAAAFNLVKIRHAVLQSPAFSAALAATFGLVHGLGFSGAMTEAQLPEGSLLWALAGFNIGVELGQLLIIAAWSLVYWAIHRWAGYGRWVVQGGSGAMIVLALYWFAERLGWLA
jgi:HupE / UreJ protein